MQASASSSWQGSSDFWLSIGLSLSRIAAGFASALTAGTVLAAASARLPLVRELLAPLVATIKSVPVASFVILILIWVSSDRLSVAISFLMVFPIVYTTMLEGIEQTDPDLLEMADVFEVGRLDRLRFIYASQVLPYFQAACSLSLGMCWKAGIAAEVIGLPAPSIGEHLYEAKVYLATSDLFAWTFVIICISIAGEALFYQTRRRRRTRDRTNTVERRERRPAAGTPSIRNKEAPWTNAVFANAAASARRRRRDA